MGSLDRKIFAPNYSALVGIDQDRGGVDRYFDTGGTADNVEIQKAINYAAGGLTLLTAETFDIAAKMTVTDNGAVVRGLGFDTVLKMSAADYAIEISGNNAKLEYFKVDGSTTGYGVYANDADDIIMDHIHGVDCVTAFNLKDSSRSRLHLIEALNFSTYGLLYDATTLVADQYVDNFYIESSNSAAIGIRTEEGVNGLRFSNGLIAGATKTGLAYGIDVEGSYSGGWLQNVVIDSISGTGIRYVNGATHGCHDTQMNNVWVLTCGGHGLEMVGTASYPLTGFQISNSKFKLIDYASVKMEYVTHSSFNNVHMVGGGAEETAANRLMTCLHIRDGVQTTTFSDCYIGWMFTSPANRAYPVEIICEDGVDGTETYISVRFVNCCIRDPGADEGARIRYLRETAFDHVYAYARDCATNNFDEAPNNILFEEDGAGETADAEDEHECQIGVIFNW